MASLDPTPPGLARAIFEDAVFGIFQVGLDGRVTAANAAAGDQLGHAPADLVGRAFEDLVHPDDAGAARAAFEDLAAGRKRALRLEVRYRRAGGATGWARLTAQGVEEAAGRPRAILVMAEDATGVKRREALAQGERGVLELIARGSPLAVTLEAIVALIEAQSDEMLGSILLVDPEGRVHVGARGRLPAAYNAAIEGQPIGPKAGSCGTAAYTRQTVVTPDIATDPRWEDYRAAALAAGLASSWSTPLFSSDGRVLGTLAQYYHTARDPAPSDEQLVAIARHLAEIAIEHKQHDLALRDARDTLERRVAERTEALSISEARLRAVVDNTPDAVFIKALDGRLLHVNQAFARMLGRPAEQLVGGRYEDLAAPELARLGTAHDAEVLARGEALTFEEQGPMRDGQVRTFLATRFPYRADDGAVKGVIGIARDITDRQQAAEALRRSERLLSEAQSLAHMGSWEWDVAANRVHWSDELFRIYGLTPSAFGATFEAFLGQIRADDRPMVEEAVRRAVELHEPYNIVEHVVRPNGEERVLASSGQVEVGPDGRTTRLWGICLDMTERAHAEAELQRLYANLERRVAERTRQLEAANHELEAFSYSVSHDLRAPLRAIDGFSQALLEDYAARLDATGQDYLRRVRTATQRMAQLIDDMLQLSRLTRGELRWGPVDLSAIAADALRELRAGQPERALEVVVAPGLTARGDARLLRAALENLLANAWKFTAHHPRARIEVGRTAVEGGEEAFFVRDDGAGFDMAYADKLFKPFSRLHAASEFEGNGVGLATVQRVVHRHGGRIWAEAAPERGATFYFTLPEGS